ncbi:3060_t:CDS:2, partial [Scutellospora calospora]
PNKYRKRSVVRKVKLSGSWKSRSLVLERSVMEKSTSHLRKYNLTFMDYTDGNKDMFTINIGRNMFANYIENAFPSCTENTFTNLIENTFTNYIEDTFTNHIENMLTNNTYETFTN